MRPRPHTPELLAFLQDTPQGDLRSYHVYQSPRPTHASWLRIPDAPHVHRSLGNDGDAFYVAVPALLDRETVNRYELQFVSSPQEQTEGGRA